jgi:protein-disulfide isomerase
MITRREALVLLGSAAASAALLPGMPASAQNAAPADLMSPGPLPDIPLGPADAKVTIIEYASVTCPACANFHGKTFPELKKRYIDTGKVRFIFREFSRNPLDTAGYMLARCDGGTNYMSVVDLLMERQQSWAFGQKPLDALTQLMRQAGFSQEKFEACLRDQKLYDAVNAATAKAQKLGVDSTPTFFLNGTKRTGVLSIDEIEKTIKPMLGV